MRLWCMVAAVLVLGSASVSAQSVRAGIEAWQRSDYPAAVAIWRPLAESGNPDAAFNLGQAYRLGRGVPMNLAAAQAWFDRAARKGHLDAQTTLGLLLFQNGNEIGGLRWLKKAAEQGEPRALLIYGTALFNGDGVARDPVLGYAYVSRAAAQGLAAARDTLAELDEILPLEQRKKGVGIAMSKAKEAPAPGAKPAKPAPAPAKPAKKTPPAKAAEVATSKPAPKPAAPPAPKAVTAAPATGAWRIQLGAFSQRSSAEALYRKVAGVGALAGRTPFYVAAGSVTRLQLGPFPTRAAAQAACSALKGQACFPVSAK